MMMGSVSKCIVFLLLVAIGNAVGCKQNPFFKDAGPLVETNEGSIVGKYVQVFDTEVAAFLGIPYGKPPVGEKRFLKSEPVEPWEGVKLAQMKPTPCMQFINRNYSFVPKTAPSEDCLYLNVWTPANRCCGDSKKLPVLFWIHGGGFAFGSSDTEVYDGRILASYGDVVVVTINYRLGIFGFLNVGTDDAPGNAGMFDQALALKWVHDNIHHFGGDPDRITIFGESAGSISTSLHLISPVSRGLFHRAILQSGTAYANYLIDKLDVALLKANAISKAVGCAKEDTDLSLNLSNVMECLKQIDAMELSKAESVTTSKTMVMFFPSPGNEFLPKNPKELFDANGIAPVDIMMGGMKDEGTMFLYFLMPDRFPMDQEPEISALDTKDIIKELFHLLPDSTIDSIHDEYLKDVSSDDKSALIENLSNSIGDLFFNCPALFFAEKAPNVYMYWITHRSLKDSHAEWTGVEHFADVAYVFGWPIEDNEHYTPEDRKFSGDLINKWVTFARTGYPLPENSKQVWKKFTSENPFVYELNSRIHANILYPRKEACEFWRSMFGSS